MLSDNPVEYLSSEEVQQDNPGNRTTFKIVVVSWWESMHQSVYFLFHAMPHDEIDNCSLKEQLEAAQTPHLRFKKATKHDISWLFNSWLVWAKSPTICLCLL